MSDQNEDIRLLASNTFASLMKLIPLEGTVHVPEDIPKHVTEKMIEEKKFFDQLVTAKGIDDYQLSVVVDADLRHYQKDGINWLTFLNRYRLHGILCDDMGLGKTLQTLCVIANDHHEVNKPMQRAHEPHASVT